MRARLPLLDNRRANQKNPQHDKRQYPSLSDKISTTHPQQGASKPGSSWTEESKHMDETMVFKWLEIVIINNGN